MFWLRNLGLLCARFVLALGRLSKPDEQPTQSTSTSVGQASRCCFGFAAILDIFTELSGPNLALSPAQGHPF
jgi:hypothetical protein